MVGFFQTKTIGLFLCLFTGMFAYGQNPQVTQSGIRIMFYNVENLFHPSNDSIKNDDEFTEDGMRHWTHYRYQEKINKVCKTALALGEWEPPAVIGLCEIENIQCLQDLVHNSPLKKFGYKIAFHDCDDKRGIDVALLYRPEYFELLSFESIKLNFPEEGSRPTRDISYTKGIAGKDTLHLFVNHWPSRYGGQLATVPKRNYAATVLRAKFDSITAVIPSANIIAMGDFNDHPDDESMLDILKAKKSIAEMEQGDLLNMIWQYEFKKGTHKYDHEWGILDQFIVSTGLIDSASALYSKQELAQIFDADFLLEPEKDGVGKITNRTYIGFRFHGGWSDHLPIYMDVLFKK
ncbi:MAG: hypothetical protein ACI8ZM_004866 [Crocinitomix sp.]|jgi:hypothetical protein